MKISATLLWSVGKFALAGLAAGALSGLFGVGGGVVMVPLLAQAFGFEQHTAQGTSLAAMVLIAVAGCAKYATRGHVAWGPAAAIAFGAVIGAAFIGADLALHMKQSVLARLFGLLMIIVGLRMLGVYTLIVHALGFGDGVQAP